MEVSLIFFLCTVLDRRSQKIIEELRRDSVPTPCIILSTGNPRGDFAPEGILPKEASYPWFRNRGTERGEVTCPRTCNNSLSEPELEHPMLCLGYRAF